MSKKEAPCTLYAAIGSGVYIHCNLTNSAEQGTPDILADTYTQWYHITIIIMIMIVIITNIIIIIVINIIINDDNIFIIHTITKTIIIII